MADHDQDMEKILRRLQLLESRLDKVESTLSLTESQISFRENTLIQQDVELSQVPDDDEEKGIESQIGRFGLAWMGNIVLLLGITFLTQYMLNTGHRIFSFILGYLFVAGLFLIAEYIKKTNTYLTSIFRLNGHVLLFYLTVRLHFFSSSPVIPQKWVSILLLLMIVAVEGYLSIRNKSQVYAGLSLIFAISVAMLGDSTNITLPILILAASGAIFMYYRFGWKPVLIITMLLSYIAFILWLLGDPVAGHPMQLITKEQSGIIYLLLLGACFSLTALFRKKDSESDDFFVSLIFINGIMFTLLLLFIVLRFYSNSYVPLFTAITFCCLVFSVILHSRSDWNFASAFYALYGFMAMSIALYGIFGLPGVYLLLSLQSLLVVSMALWFRNRLIIVMNSILFLSILIIYLFSSKIDTGVNFSFALTALISARIINWKKSRLKIETDMMRNLYMVEGFIMMLFALLHAVPKQFITFSWTMTALLYFVISLLLKNIKYRYMALGTMIASAVYLFIIDLARIEIIYRVLALLFLSAISIGISIYYTNHIKKAGN
jgi:hypothetical protein